MLLSVDSARTARPSALSVVRLEHVDLPIVPDLNDSLNADNDRFGACFDSQAVLAHSQAPQYKVTGRQNDIEEEEGSGGREREVTGGYHAFRVGAVSRRLSTPVAVIREEGIHVRR